MIGPRGIIIGNHGSKGDYKVRSEDFSKPVVLVGSALRGYEIGEEVMVGDIRPRDIRPSDRIVYFAHDYRRISLAQSSIDKAFSVDVSGISALVVYDPKASEDYAHWLAIARKRKRVHEVIGELENWGYKGRRGYKGRTTGNYCYPDSSHPDRMYAKSYVMDRGHGIDQMGDRARKKGILLVPLEGLVYINMIKDEVIKACVETAKLDKKPKYLLLEDNIHDIRRVKPRLEKLGFELWVPSDPFSKETLDWNRENKPVVVQLDGLRGDCFVLYRDLFPDNPDAHYVLYSGLSRLKDEIGGRDIHFIKKPFDGVNHALLEYVAQFANKQ